MENDDVLKIAFAKRLMERPNDAMAIALAMFPDPGDTVKALTAGKVWPTDSLVMQYMQSAEYTPAAVLPSKLELAAEILGWARALKPHQAAERERYVRLYADMMGHIEKPGTTVNVNTQTNNKVLVMPAPINNADWSLMATAQQRQLEIDGARMAKELPKIING